MVASEIYEQSVVHFEIGCRDAAATEQFYAKLFDWKMAAMGPAVMIDTGAGGIAGHITALGHEPHQFTHFYGNTVGIWKPK